VKRGNGLGVWVRNSIAESVKPGGALWPRTNGQVVHDGAEFRAMIDRERGLCDRGGQKFALVVFMLPENGQRRHATRGLFACLHARTRSTDEVGWLGADDIGILLPGTGSGGALHFAADVTAATRGDWTAELTYHVYMYPGHHDGDDRQLWLGGLREKTRAVVVSDLPALSRSPRPVMQAEGFGGHVDEAKHRHDRAIGSHRCPACKRLVDMVGATLALILFFPVMLLVALLIKCVSPGPVLFRQARIGYKGRLFSCYKFRTMHVQNRSSAHESYWGQLISSSKPMTKLETMDQDPRLIRFGRTIRQTALDELPQLFNVLRGDMSLVGPRPCIPYEYEKYALWHRGRVDALPGMTGLWQVSGKNRRTFTEMIRLDISYAKRWSLWLDLGILLRTVPAILEQVRE